LRDRDAPVPGKKRQHITAADAPRIFDDACIEELAKIGHLPAGADRQRFADSVREAVRIYARDARKPTATELRAEIAALLRAAERRHYERVAGLIEKLSPQARRLFDARAERPGFEMIIAENERPLQPERFSSAAQRHRIRPLEEYPPPPPQTDLKMPSPDTLRDPARRDQACKAVEIFCRAGGRYIAGRMRPSGKRSRTWERLLHAPQPIERPPRLEAELEFAMHLQLAWLEATGKMPSLAANPARLGPFGRMVEECLQLVGGEARHANVAKLLNELNKRRKETRARLDRSNDKRPVSSQR